MANYTLDNFDEWIAKAERRVEEVIERFNWKMVYEIVDATPVGNPNLWKSKPPADYVPGTLKANWIASLGQSSFLFDKDLHISDTNRAAKQHADITSNSAGKVFYLVNNAPYARRIEYTCWSSQAPSGMLRITVAKRHTMLNQAIKEAK